MVDIRNRPCPADIKAYVGNLTSSYTDQSNEVSMVAASVIMFVLAGLFFNLNLFSGISDVSATLDPKVRLFLTSALSLFLPVMSYLLSEAKNAAYTTTRSSSSGTASAATDLSLMAGLILAWMLLVELLRKKVDEIRMRGFSGTIQRAGRVSWLGSLVFFNIKSAGRKAVFSILWILCATKVLQRVAFTEIGKRSYAHGKNARLISSYMSQILEQEPPHHQQEAAAHVRSTHGGNGNELLRACKYIVMGEEKLVGMEPTADGYKLEKTNPDPPGYRSVTKLLAENDSIVTVGKIWELDDKDKFFSSHEQLQRLKRICLSFALFKLLRRRFEHLPVVAKEETDNSRRLILSGLYGETRSAEAVFQVMHDEINFLSEYYHSVVPVVLASPSFLLVNYFLLNIIVAILCFMTVILCGNGDVGYAFHSIGADNYTLQSGVPNIVLCLVVRAMKSPSAFFSIVDLSITVLLFVIFFYEEIWEFLVFLLSNWFVVSLLYNYTAKPRWLRKATLRGAFFWGGFSIIMWLRSKTAHHRVTFRQFSALNVRWPLKLPLFAAFTSLVVKKEVVPNSVKKSIMDYLAELEHHRGLGGSASHYALDCGRSALRRNGVSGELWWACKSDSVSEVILTWHVATSIMEVERRPLAAASTSTAEEETSSRVAIKLSKYCAYLVAFHPELLPENPEKVELVFEKMKEELKGMIGCREYYLSPLRKRVHNFISGEARDQPQRRRNQAVGLSGQSNKVVRDGIELARSLMAGMGGEATTNDSNTWKVLADVWTELIVYVAPSSDEERVKGHEEVLVQGGEFITVLWALTTHIGVSRPPTTNRLATDVVHLDA